MKLGRILCACVGIFFGVIAPNWPAKADCVDDCDISTYCDSQMHASGECASKLQQCYQLECNKPKVVYGAIAYGEECDVKVWSCARPRG
ncbi:MAG: hypothetical protein ACM3O6_01965 [Acidobacteriota bacterium]